MASLEELMAAIDPQQMTENRAAVAERRDPRRMTGNGMWKGTFTPGVAPSFDPSLVQYGGSLEARKAALRKKLGRDPTDDELSMEDNSATDALMSAVGDEPAQEVAAPPAVEPAGMASPVEQPPMAPPEPMQGTGMDDLLAAIGFSPSASENVDPSAYQAFASDMRPPSLTEPPPFDNPQMPSMATERMQQTLAGQLRSPEEMLMGALGGGTGGMAFRPDTQAGAGERAVQDTAAMTVGPMYAGGALPALGSALGAAGDAALGAQLGLTPEVIAQIPGGWRALAALPGVAKLLRGGKTVQNAENVARQAEQKAYLGAEVPMSWELPTGGGPQAGAMQDAQQEVLQYLGQNGWDQGAVNLVSWEKYGKPFESLSVDELLGLGDLVTRPPATGPTIQDTTFANALQEALGMSSGPTSYRQMAEQAATRTGESISGMPFAEGMVTPPGYGRGQPQVSIPPLPPRMDIRNIPGAFERGRPELELMRALGELQ